MNKDETLFWPADEISVRGLAKVKVSAPSHIVIGNEALNGKGAHRSDCAFGFTSYND